MIEEPTLWKTFFPLIFVSGDDKQVHGNISTGTVSSTSAPDEASSSVWSLSSIADTLSRRVLYQGQVAATNNRNIAIYWCTISPPPTPTLSMIINTDTETPVDKT